MKLLCALGLLLAASGAAEPGAFSPHAGPRPVLVWIQTDPWAMVIGADTPMVSLYEDGALICVARGGDNSTVYLQKRLSVQDRDEMVRTIRTLGTFSGLKARYDVVSGVTDMPSTRFYLDLGGGPSIATEIHGLALKDTPMTKVTHRKVDQLPASLAALHKYLAAIPCEGAPWIPEYIEVMLWPYEYAPDDSIHWPSDWPSLDSPRAMRRGDSYSIYIPGPSVDRLRAFLKTRKERGAVEVGGKKWAASYRYVFPSEPVWMKAFR